jgi:hypothetical protein
MSHPRFHPPYELVFAHDQPRTTGQAGGAGPHDPRDGGRARSLAYDRTAPAAEVWPGNATHPATARNRSRARRRGAVHRRGLPQARPRHVHQIAQRRVPVSRVPERCRVTAPAHGQGDLGGGGRWRVHDLRLLQVHGRASVSSPGADTQSVQHLGARCDACSCQGARGGSKVRPSLRQLPRRGGGRSSYTAREVERLTLRVSTPFWGSSIGRALDC